MPTRSTTVHRRRDLYSEAVEIVEQEYAEDLELEAVAHRIATSRRQLQRAFAEAGNTSFRDHLAAVRMRHAVEMLEAGSTPVRDVAMSVGYRQPAQFAKAFRRHYGATPTAFRRRVQPIGNGRRPEVPQPASVDSRPALAA